MFQVEEIKKVFNLKKSASKGWFLGICPYCGKIDHLGVLFGTISSFKCHKCGEHGTIFRLLKKAGRLDLYDYNKLVILNSKLQSKITENIDEINSIISTFILPEKSNPAIAFKRLSNHPYLESRGFTSEQYIRFPVGVTSIDLDLKNYLIFLIINDKENRGWIGRSILSKEEIDRINYRRKQLKQKKILRYINAGVDISKLLYGYDEIESALCGTVILVEGITDKFNTDRELGLYNDETIKCCSTFGKNISDFQLYLLLKKGVQNIILLYEADAINDIKKNSLKLINYFNVECGFIPFGDKDPGDLVYEEFIEIINKVESAFSYNITKLAKSKLI